MYKNCKCYEIVVFCFEIRYSFYMAEKFTKAKKEKKKPKQNNPKKKK